MNNHPPAKSLFDSWLTVKLLAEAEPAFTEAAIRSLVFNADDRPSSRGIIPGNGLASHIRRVNTKVVLNHGGFLSWIDLNGKKHCERVDEEDNVEGRESPVIIGLPEQEKNKCQSSKQAGRRRS